MLKIKIEGDEENAHALKEKTRDTHRVQSARSHVQIVKEVFIRSSVFLSPSLKFYGRKEKKKREGYLVCLKGFYWFWQIFCVH